MRRLFLAFALASVAVALLAGGASSAISITALGDLYPGATGSDSGRFTPVGDTVFFRANDAVHGYELWRSDGTEAGTQLVRDINPGSASSYPGSFYSDTMVESGGRLFFWANDGVHGEELWVSDGTSDGTTLVADIRPGTQSSVVSALVPFEGGVIFNEYIPSSSESGLWRSDGTAAGTTFVKGVNGGSFTLVGDTVFFSGDDGVHGSELWSTDGTSDGTVMVKDILPGDRFASSRPTELTEAGGQLFFVAGEYEHGDELWMSDGTETGTVRLTDIQPGPTRTPIWSLTNVEGTLYFVAVAPVHGESMWKSDGTAAGTALVWDPPSANAGLINLTAMGDTLFFVYLYQASGPALWKSAARPPERCKSLNQPARQLPKRLRS